MLRVAAGALDIDRQARAGAQRHTDQPWAQLQGLTPEGERLVVWAKRILAEQEAFKAEVAAVQSGITGTLRLGTEPTASTTLALPVAAFCAAHPLAKVRVDSRVSTTELARQLREFELDVAIAHFAPEDRAGLQVVPLYEERYILLASSRPADARGQHHELGGRRPAAAGVADAGMRIRQVIDNAFKQSGVTVTPQVETDSVASLGCPSTSDPNPGRGPADLPAKPGHPFFRPPVIAWVGGPAVARAPLLQLAGMADLPLAASRNWRQR